LDLSWISTAAFPWSLAWLDTATKQASGLRRGYVIPEGATGDQKSAARQRSSLVIDRCEPLLPGKRTGGHA